MLLEAAGSPFPTSSASYSSSSSSSGEEEQAEEQQQPRRRATSASSGKLEMYTSLIYPCEGGLFTSER